MRLIHTTTTDDAGQPMQTIFIVLSTYDERAVPARLGFVWNRIIEKAWATTSKAVARAAALEPGMTADTITVLALVDGGSITRDEAATINQSPASRKDQAAAIALTMTDELKTIIHSALKMLAGVCDGAVQQDGIGFNGQDTQFGHELAAAHSLTNNQAAYAKLMLRKYAGQLGEEMMQAMWPEDVAEAKRIEAAKQAARDEKAATREQAKTDKENAKVIKRTAGRGKVSDELAKVLAALATCEFEEIEGFVAELKRLRATAEEIGSVTTEQLQQAAAMPLSNAHGKLYCTHCGAETPQLFGGGNLGGRLCKTCARVHYPVDSVGVAEYEADMPRFAENQPAAETQPQATQTPATATEPAATHCGTCGMKYVDGQKLCGHGAAVVNYGASVTMEYDPAPAVEKAKAAVQQVLEPQCGGTLTVENCTPENFAALVQCSELQINELMKHGGLSPELENKVRAAKADAEWVAPERQADTDEADFVTAARTAMGF